MGYDVESDQKGGREGTGTGADIAAGRRAEGGDGDRIRNLEVGSSGRKEATFAHHRFAKGASERAVPAINKRRLFVRGGRRGGERENIGVRRR